MLEGQSILSKTSKNLNYITDNEESHLKLDL